MLQQRCHSRVVQLYSRRFSFLNILRNFWFSESLSYFSAVRLSHNLRWTKQTGSVKKLTVEILTKEFIYFYTHIWFNFSRRKQSDKKQSSKHRGDLWLFQKQQLWNLKFTVCDWIAKQWMIAQNILLIMITIAAYRLKEHVKMEAWVLVVQSPIKLILH